MQVDPEMLLKTKNRLKKGSLKPSLLRPKPTQNATLTQRIQSGRTALHPDTARAEPKDVKNAGRSGNVIENKGPVEGRLTESEPF